MRLKLGKKISISNAVTLVGFAILCTGSLITYRALTYYNDSLYSESGNSILTAMSEAYQQALAGRFFPCAAIAFFFVFLLLGFLYLRHKTKANKFIFRYRYAIAFIILILCVIFEISGSSIGEWSKSLPGGENDGLLFGRPRGCRTDEYALFTGMTFAQYYDPQGSWPYFGEVLSGSSTDMFMVYGQPVLDPSILLRPFQVGFLFLGLSKGLSFYWSARIIVLFMTSFEFGRVITKDDRKLALAYALLVSLAPVISWWFSINSLVEMIICFNVLLLSAYGYIRQENKRNRTLIIVGFAYACLVFLFAIYPAWQIPLTYVLLALLFAIFHKHRRQFLANLKSDKLPLAICAILAIFCAGGVLLHSFDAIVTEMNTDYPGDRTDAGGGYGLALFRFPISLFLPFIPASAASGLSTGLPDKLTAFFDFFPLGIVLFAINSLRKKQIDHLSIALVIAILFLGIYVVIGFPEPLAKITLMGKSIPSRAIVIFSFANLILLFRELPRLGVSANRESNGDQAKNRSVAISLCCSILASIALTILCRENDIEFMGYLKSFFVFVVLFCAWAITLLDKQKLFVGLCIVIAIFSGAFVNPIQKGIDAVDSNPLITQIRSIANEAGDTKWVSAVGWMSNLTLFAGAPAVNSTNIYPVPKLWSILDPSGEAKYEWNRYAHLPCTIVSEETGHSFKRTSLDTIEIALTLKDLRQLNVGYIVTNDELELTEYEMEQLNQVYKFNNWVIYKLL